MISKREKLQYVCTFVTDILSLALSIALGWLVVDGLLGKVGNYTAPDLIQAFCLLMLAYLLTFLTFDQSENITTRPWKRELKISVKFNLILTLINSAGLLLTKAPLLSSRYFLVAVPVINVVLMTVFHSVLKKLLTTTRKKNSMESLVGVVTTGEDAGEMVRELQRDWSKRLTGIALLEIPEEQIGGQIEGVDIKANEGDPVKAYTAGMVREIYEDDLMGRVVVLEHDYGLCSYYMNLADNLPDGLEVGKEVQAGDEIGYVGTTAVLECGDGPHLHFELTVNDELIDAYKEIKAVNG